MKIRWNHRYVQLGVTAFLVIAASILFYYGIFHMKSLVTGIKTFFSIILPLLKSGMATIGLFLALGYWNDWYNAMLYMNTETKYPLQYMLYALMQKTQAMSQMASSANIPLQDMPSNSLKLAMAVVATGPIILVYPFVQKYFVKGVTIGSVKG